MWWIKSTTFVSRYIGVEVKSNYIIHNMEILKKNDLKIVQVE